MAIRDILLTLTSYPEPTPISVVDRAVSFASTLGAHIAAISCEVHIQVPGSLVSFEVASGIAAGEAHRSHSSAQALLAAFEATAQKAGVLHETIHEKSLSYRVPERLVEYARLRDLTIVSVPESYDQWYAEAIIFGSGRPTLVLPESPPSRPFGLNIAVVAWDFSRSAARAVADAIPMLEKAKGVRVVTVTNEKVIDNQHSSEELAKNLARHRIDVTLERVDATGRSIGDVFAMEVASCNADLLVMGAYGHSRFREFILGGATRSMLSKPLLPILFSH
ncbi:MAG: universal stress protein [Bradyrhizobium sp.]|uniref:universal stress protein n=1 Tax=Bradyrhizobium sp. TaxID=376 RepID=UPI002394B68D|nr:universal stress protein [Bradyrhizobium sp.]MDE2068975.1 universal stress protein [Bradyrhizobium sp.]MDE2242315.1 universal stress protein [Bradyrhizobium sp.]